ncbi:MAG: 16S rRNA (cytosine(967)-C(5))-methyltransferase RsmB [bacterium]
MKKRRSPRQRNHRNVAPARKAAVEALLRSETGHLFLNECLDQVFRELSLSDRDRRLAMEIAYGSTRFRGRLDSILAAYVNQGLESLPQPVLQILRCAAYQILNLTKIPPFAAVDDAVEQVRTAGCEGLTGLANAVLRGIIRGDRQVHLPGWETDPVGHLTVVHSHPKLLVETWLERWPSDRVHDLCRFNNEPAPLFGRVNPLKSGADIPQDNLDPTIPNCVKLGIQGNPAESSLLSEGYVTIQDPAAMLVAPLLSLKPGMRVWDVCAAPGGKCTHCAEIMNDVGQVVATDLSWKRLQTVRENMQRLGLTGIDLAVSDGLRPPWGAERPLFDAILLDAPCTGWGTLRRHPDLRWRLSPSDPERLGILASNLLTSVSRCLRRDGVLVYATCTLSHEENEDVICRFLEEHTNWRLEPVTDWLPQAFHNMVEREGWLSVFPPEAGTDGVFAARLRKVN